MRSAIRTILLAALVPGAAMASVAHKAPTFILNGYSFGRIPGVSNTAELEAKLKHRPGERITEADTVQDQAILAKELEARHIQGHLFTTLAEKHGRVWVIFDLQNLGGSAAMDKKPRHLKAQVFQGETHISATTLAAVTGFRPGDPLTPEKVNAARRAIVEEYAKSLPGRTVSLKLKMQTSVEGEVTLTWIIVEPK